MRRGLPAHPLRRASGGHAFRRFVRRGRAGRSFALRRTGGFARKGKRNAFVFTATRGMVVPHRAGTGRGVPFPCSFRRKRFPGGMRPVSHTSGKPPVCGGGLPYHLPLSPLEREGGASGKSFFMGNGGRGALPRRAGVFRRGGARRNRSAFRPHRTGVFPGARQKFGEPPESQPPARAESGRLLPEGPYRGAEAAGIRHGGRHGCFFSVPAGKGAAGAQAGSARAAGAFSASLLLRKARAAARGRAKGRGRMSVFRQSAARGKTAFFRARGGPLRLDEWAYLSYANFFTARRMRVFRRALPE